MLRHRLNILFLTLSLAWAGTVYGQSIFTYKGKTYTKQQLPAAARQQLFEIEMRNYRQIEALANDAILNMYFEEKAKKSGKSKEEIEAEELNPKKPGEAEIKKFYAENKGRIPPNYTYEQVKPEIVRVLNQEGQRAAREKLLSKIKKQGKFQFKLTAPKAPKIAINTEGFPSKGKSGAKVTIVEFADYQCPHCKAAADDIKKVMDKFGSKVELVFIDFPINRSGISRVVAEGAFCANKQKKYWEYHQLAFEKQATLTKNSPKELAKSLKLDVAAFDKCLKSAEAKSFVTRGKEEGMRVGVAATPTFFINGQKFSDGHSFESFKAKIEEVL